MCEGGLVFQHWTPLSFLLFGQTLALHDMAIQSAILQTDEPRVVCRSTPLACLRLSYSRALFLVAYPRESQETVSSFIAIRVASAVSRGTRFLPGRHRTPRIIRRLRFPQCLDGSRSA
jgi:hypothetical protein